MFQFLSILKKESIEWARKNITSYNIETKENVTENEISILINLIRSAINNNGFSFQQISKDIYEKIRVEKTLGMKNNKWCVLVSLKNTGYNGCSVPSKFFALRFGELMVEIITF